MDFPNTPAIFPSKAHLNNLLEELVNTGTIDNKKITAKTVALTLTTHASEAEIREIFSFFLQPDQLTITETNAATRGADHQDYGFFVDPDAIKSGVENAQGYGFFADPDAVKSGVENAQGYGFFEDIENHAGLQAPKPGLRRDDVPGRRTTDKAAISTAGDNSIRVSVGKVDQYDQSGRRTGDHPGHAGGNRIRHGSGDCMNA